MLGIGAHSPNSSGVHEIGSSPQVVWSEGFLPSEKRQGTKSRGAVVRVLTRLQVISARSTPAPVRSSNLTGPVSRRASRASTHVADSDCVLIA